MRTQHKPRKFSDEALLSYIEHYPSATLEDIANHLSVKIPSVHARLKQCNITRKKTFLYEERDEQARAKFIEELNTITDQLIVYIDESGIKNTLKNPYGRSLRGRLILDDKKGHATEKLNIIAGLLNHQLIAPLTYAYSTDTSLFNTWLEQCFIPVLPEKSVVIMDNARFHKSDKTRQMIEAHGHRLLFLPAYSPNLNPIEQYWAILKAKIKKCIFDYPDLYSCIDFVFRTN